ncbi:MAG: ATP-binding cassette domain-containing protein, partial [Anaerolineae bacterium]
RILAGYMPPSSGTAKVAGYDVITDSLEARRHVGYLPETVPLYTEMTVHSYLRFFARLRGVANVRDRVDYVVDACGLDGYEDQVIGRLSRGYRQRVGLAQALVHNPDVLILDEPTVGLDPRQIADVRALIRSLGGDHTVILSTHILPEVSQTCSRVLIIDRGVIVAEDSPQQLASRVRSGQRVVLRLGRQPEDAIAVLGAVPGVISVDAADDGQLVLDCDPTQECRPAIAAAAVLGGWELLELRAEDVSLEEVFLRLTGVDAAGEPEAAA